MSEIEELKAFIETQNLQLKKYLDSKMEEVAESIKNPHFEERYINCTEVQRILNVSAPVVTHWVRDGLLTTRNAKGVINNRFLLSEIEWLKNQPYRKASAEMIRELIRKNDREYYRV